MTISITDNAVKHMSEMAEKEGSKFIRIGLSGGGCSGFQYLIGLDEEKNIAEDDIVIIENGTVKFVVDPMSMMYLDDSTVDVVEEMMGKYIKISNPNVESQCGCGNSVGF
jgi:iron-sulfur cluster assembly accessory protein